MHISTHYIKMSNVTVSISNDNQVLKEIAEAPGQTMPDLIAALGKIKSLTNDYLTELIESSKAQTQAEKSKFIIGNA